MKIAFSSTSGKTEHTEEAAVGTGLWRDAWEILMEKAEVNCWGKGLEFSSVLKLQETNALRA